MVRRGPASFLDRWLGRAGAERAPPRGGDVAVTTAAAEVAEAARRLNRLLTRQTYLHSVARDRWNPKSGDAAS